jgi:hypothetical protein
MELVMIAALSSEVQEGLDFIINHLHNPLWPRTISTKTTENRQVLVRSREEALARFEQANLLDCKISAYPPNADENPSAVARFQGLRTSNPTNILAMIDFDRSDFKSERTLILVLKMTLKNIRDRLGVYSTTVLWSGRGYHILQPLDTNEIILEYIKQFENVQQPSLKFLRFVEWFLSNGKCDLQHNNTVSFGNCMLRIPGSINSKSGQAIRIIQRWNGCRPQINYLLRDFRRYLIDQKFQQLKHQQSYLKKCCLKKCCPIKYSNKGSNSTINWIERLLNTPICNYRKLVVWHILAPYLINKRGLSYDRSYSIIHDWLDKCNKVKKLDFTPHYKIKSALNCCSNFMPISKGRLKAENDELYRMLLVNGVFN